MKNKSNNIAILQTWFNNDNINIDPLQQILNYILIYQIQKTSNEGGLVEHYINKTSPYNVLEKVSTNNKHLKVSL